MLPAFELSRPTTLDEAVAQLADGGVPYVGGTELIAAMHLGLFAPPRLVDLKPVPDLTGIDVSEGWLHIGAATRHREVAASPQVTIYAPILATACGQLGNARVRATGSIGGNLCFADPRSDVATALFALGARVKLYSARGRRMLPIEDFLLGAMDADREPDEVLESVEVPLTDRHQVYMRHQPAEYPTACVAVVAGRTDADPSVKIVIGAIGERPQSFSAPSLVEVDIDSIVPGLDVIEDLNGSEPYKRHLAGVFVTRAVKKLKETIDA